MDENPEFPEFNAYYVEVVGASGGGPSLSDVRTIGERQWQGDRTGTRSRRCRLPDLP